MVFLTLKRFSSLFLLLSLTACLENETAVRPDAIALTTEHTGYFCSMNITEHTGPKAQIHVQGKTEPLWFSQVRDMFGFIMLPGENKNITALYVTDMAGKTDWDHTNAGPWIDPKTAYFVVNSTRTGGMGALEVVPFSIRSDAEKFTLTYGGEIIRYGDVSSDYIFETSTLSDNAENAQSGAIAQ